VISPRSENFSVKNANFFNYNFNAAGALGDCSHCTHPASSDNGGRTTKTSGLTFDDTTVTRRISFMYPNNGIYWDLDGSLTGIA